VIYWITGHQRTGTSMMMSALIAGGMEARWTPSMDDIIEKNSFDGYRMNPESLYELHPSELKKSDFRKRSEGKLVKCMMPGIVKYAWPEDKIVFMQRDFDEAQESCKLAGVGLMTEDKEEMARIVASARRRLRRCSVAAFDYPDVVKNPGTHFKMLEMLGWPIDPEKAEAVVDPEHYRVRSAA
jgi:hypothetical protein